MRSWRSELATMSTVLAVPLLIAVVFPYDAVDFKPESHHREKPAKLLFAKLTESEETAALKAAKSSQRDVANRQQVDLSFGELPDDGMVVEVLAIENRGRGAEVQFSRLGMPPFMPSQAAARPAKIAAEPPMVPHKAFSREDLLNID